MQSLQKMQERDLLNRPKQQKRKLLHTKKTEKQPDLQNRKKKKSSRKSTKNYLQRRILVSSV